MPNTKKTKDILNRIEIEKELLSTMPVNNEKNRKKFLDKISELKEEYQKYEAMVLEIFNKRYQTGIEGEVSREIENLEVRINTIENVLYLFDDAKTPYEKIGLDKIIFKIGKYYKGNLNFINEQIKAALERFEKNGIELDLSDFNYSSYVEQYMAIFLEELKKDDINSSRLKAEFDKIYWKCPDIIMHIEMNLRNIYFQNEAQIDKFLKKERNELLKNWCKTPEEIKKVYFDLKKKKEETTSTDSKLMLDEFITGKLNVNEFSDDKLKSNYMKVIEQDMTENLDELEKNIFEFLNTLYEYKNYIKFKFIIDDIKKRYQEKEKYKKTYDDTKKKIDANEKKLRKVTKKKFFFFRKNKEQKQLTQQSQIISEIKELYKELDLNKFYNKIYTELTDTSTIYDLLNLANSYYNYMITYMLQNDKNLNQEDAEKEIEQLDKFLKNPFNNLINNIMMLEEKNIALVIKDRYKLLNFNIEKEDLDISNIDTLIEILEGIYKIFCFKKTGLQIENIQEVLALKKVLKIK